MSWYVLGRLEVFVNSSARLPTTNLEPALRETVCAYVQIDRRLFSIGSASPLGHTDGRDAAPRVRRVGPRVRARAFPSRTSRFRARTPSPRALEPATPPERSPSDEPAAPHRVFSRFAVAGGPRTPTDVIPNKFVEANGAAREVLEKGFRFTPRNLGIFAVFGIAVPVIIYKGCVNEFVRAQEKRSASRVFFFPRRSRAATTNDSNDSLPAPRTTGNELTTYPRVALARNSATRIRSTAAPRRSSCEETLHTPRDATP